MSPFSKFPSAAAASGLLYLLVMVLLQLLHLKFVSSHPCLPQEKAALLHFKTLFSIQSKTDKDPLYYPCGDNSYLQTESWNQGSDCCSSWAGVTCDGADGHVTDIDLTCSWLRPITPFTNTSSMLGPHHLPRLRSLNLAFNVFSGSQMPSEIAGFPGLEYLNISYTFMKLDTTTSFKTLVTNLTRLQVLDLSSSHLSSVSFASPINFTHSLRLLLMDNCRLQGRLHEETFKNLPNLERLSLSYNPDLQGIFPQLNWSSPIEFLDLSATDLSGSLPKSIGKLNKLKTLDLRECHFSGSIPDSFSNFTQLTFLDMCSNELTGPIPAGIFSLPQLQYVSLSRNFLTGHLLEFHCKALKRLELQYNELQGSIPGSLLRLVNLTELNLRSNKLNGTVDLSKFSNLQNLHGLDFSENNLTVSTKQVTSNSPELAYFGLGSCNLSEFPGFIRNSSRLSYLDLSNNKLKGEVPGRMLEVGKSTLIYLNMSNNFLTSFQEISWEKLYMLDLHSNSIIGNISILAPQLVLLLLANNKLTGRLPHSLCSSLDLLVLDLSNNSLSGTIPQCLTESKELVVLDLGINKFHGTIPDTFPLGCQLQTVNLRDNELEGRVPQSLANCTMLVVLDLGKNKLNDTFPTWLAPLSELEVLVLHYNQLYGYLLSSESEIQFSKLRILDVSNNKFNGIISKSFLRHFMAMKSLLGIVPL